ncbi:MAG TPA: EF-hand domain-containing protein [Sphingomicrobium sp.]|nr:EF-hand domain-containing protein [Sphingomicrobium sp.]
MKKFIPFGAAAAVLLAGSAGLAQSAARSGHSSSYHRSSKPQTRAQAQARVAKTFARLDTNHDGYITEAEVQAVDAARAQKRQARAQNFDPSKIFDRLDRDHDGKITVAEAAARRGHRGGVVQSQATGFTGMFARADTNKDGVITRAEFESTGEQLRTRMQHLAVARRGASGLFANADANKDGRISEAELEQDALAKFDRMDLNHDGTVTPEERQQSRQLFRAHRGRSATAAKR